MVRFLEEAKHIDWLDSILNQKLISREIHDEADAAFNLLKRLYEGTLQIPATCTGPDGRLMYSWDKDEHHLEVEFIPNELTELFYRNRKTEEIWEGELNNFKDLYQFINYFKPYFVEDY